MKHTIVYNDFWLTWSQPTHVPMATVWYKSLTAIVHLIHYGAGEDNRPEYEVKSWGVVVKSTRSLSDAVAEYNNIPEPKADQ